MDTALQTIAEQAVERRGVPGVVAAIAGHDHASVAVAGRRAIGGARMTRDTDGEGKRGRVLAADSVARMLAPGEPSAPDHAFLEGQSWSLGGSIDVVARHPWEVVGRYGWIGGTGTALSVYPGAAQVAIWLSQRELAGADNAERLVPMLALAAERARR